MNTKTHTNRRTTLLAVLVATSLIFSSAPVAHAKDTETTTTITTNTDNGYGNLTMGDLADRYAELSAGLLGAGFDEAKFGFGGATVSQFAEKLGLEGRSKLLEGGYAFHLDTSAFTNLTTYAENFWKSSGVNGRVAASASLYATHLGSLKVPELSIDSFDVPELEVPEEALLFGLFYDASITEAVNSGILARIQQSGFSDGSIVTEFSKSMQSAAEKLDSTLSDGLISPCMGAFLAAMGGGISSVNAFEFSPDCSACTAGGLYMHHEMNRLMDKAFDLTYYDTGDDVMDPKEYEELPDWLYPVYEDQDPIRMPKLHSARGGSKTETGMAYKCNAAAQAGARSLRDIVTQTTKKLNTGTNRIVD